MMNKAMCCFIFVAMILLLIGCAPNLDILNFESTTNVSERSTSINSTVSPTPFQTIEPTQALPQDEIFIMDLYENNGGCEFPCFWGIMPGRDTMQTVYDRFSPYVSFEDRTKDDDIMNYIAMIISPTEEMNTTSQDERIVYIGVESGIVKKISTSTINSSMFANDTLEALLTYFGAPEEIWIFLNPGMGEEVSYSIVLFYSKNGTFISWNGKADVILETDSDMTVSICPQNMEEDIDMVEYLPPNFYFWPPKENLTFEEINSKRLLNEPYRLLSDQNSNFDADIFYKTYLLSETETCFKFSYPY